MKKVLILGASSPQYDAIQKLKEMGYVVHAAAMSEEGPGVHVADFFVKINIIESEKIAKYMTDNDIDIVYSVGSDLAMPTVAKVSEDLGLKHFVSFETATICNKKNLMRERTKGITGTVPSQVVESYNSKLTLSYPVFVKPADSQGQRGISLVLNESQLKTAIQDALQYSRNKLAIIERYIDGYEISVNGYIVNGQIKFLLVSVRETWPQYEGLIQKHIIDFKKEFPVESIQKSIQEHLEVLAIKNGPFYAQMKIESNDAFMIEITPRFDGCHMHKLIEYATGIDLLELTFQHLIEDVEPSFVSTKKNSVTLEFQCHPPYESIDYDSFEKKDDYLEYQSYYNSGDTVKPINGVYEKVGYYIYS